MTAKPKLLKPKAQTKASHNPDLQTLVDAVQRSTEIPFQVRLREDLAGHTSKSVLCKKQPQPQTGRNRSTNGISCRKIGCHDFLAYTHQDKLGAVASNAAKGTPVPFVISASP